MIWNKFTWQLSVHRPNHKYYSSKTFCNICSILQTHKILLNNSACVYRHYCLLYYSLVFLCRNHTMFCFFIAFYLMVLTVLWLGIIIIGSFKYFIIILFCLNNFKYVFLFTLWMYLKSFQLDVKSVWNFSVLSLVNNV